MTYTEAKKELKRVGTGRATGDPLRAMYARLISFHCRVDGPKGMGDTTRAIYQHLQDFASDKVAGEGRRIMANPVEASNVAFLPLKAGV